MHARSMAGRVLVIFPNSDAGEGSLPNYRVVFIPDCLSSDSTLAQASARVYWPINSLLGWG